MKKIIKNHILNLAKKLSEKNWKLVTVESCTGGGLAYHLCLFPSSSTLLDRGLVTYSDKSKHDLLAIPIKKLHKYGPVSKEIAKQLAQQSIKASKADFSIAITGLAGPEHDGISKETIGTVYIACATKKNCKTYKIKSTGNREKFCETTIAAALKLSLKFLNE